MHQDLSLPGVVLLEGGRILTLPAPAPLLVPDLPYGLPPEDGILPCPPPEAGFLDLLGS